MSKYANQLFVMRHGNSMANQNKIIVSDPANGIDQYGLSELGQQQALSSVNNTTWLDAETIIYSSDFARAHQTAEIARTILGCASVETTEALRERFFGKFELGPDCSYDEVWANDLCDPDHTIDGVESVNNVKQRAVQLLDQLDQRHRDKTILLVSHGDLLQILLTAMSGVDCRHHRSIPHLNTAEIRELA